MNLNYLLPRISMGIALLCFAGASSEILLTLNNALLDKSWVWRPVLAAVNKSLEYCVVGFVFLVLYAILSRLKRIEDALHGQEKFGQLAAGERKE